MNKKKIYIYIEAQKHRYHNMADEQKQKYIEAQKHRYHNMTDKQKQKYKEAQKAYKKI